MVELFVGIAIGKQILLVLKLCIMENNESLNDILARAANDPYNKEALALAILLAAKNDMDPAALKAITAALEESKYKEIDSIPITAHLLH